jgi:transcription elongation GreA/GreB family factor
MNPATDTQHQQPQDYALTPEGLASLRAELDTLREKRSRISDEGRMIREEQVVLESRIAVLEEILDEAWVVDPATLETDIVAIGVTVGLRDLDSHVSERYRVVGKHEPLRPGELSAASAVGRALIGSRVGENVTVDLPNGSVRRLEIISAEPRGSATG